MQERRLFAPLTFYVYNIHILPVFINSGRIFFFQKKKKKKNILSVTSIWAALKGKVWEQLVSLKSSPYDFKSSPYDKGGKYIILGDLCSLHYFFHTHMRNVLNERYAYDKAGYQSEAGRSSIFKGTRDHRFQFIQG